MAGQAANVLASALAQSLSASDRDLVLLEGKEWVRHPWPEIHARAQNAAERLLDADIRCIGLVGAPTAELLGTVVGAFYAGAAVSVLPGPIRGADVTQWAHATAARFRGISAQWVGSQGEYLDKITSAGAALDIVDLTELAPAQRSAGLQLPTIDAPVAIMQGTAGSTGTPRTVQLPPAAVLANLSGLNDRIGVGAEDIGCSWLPLYHDMGLSFILTGALAGREFWQAPTAAFQASPFRWLNWLSDSRASITAGPNMAYGMIGKYSRRVTDVDLSAVRAQRRRTGRLRAHRTLRHRDGAVRVRCRRTVTVLRSGRVHLRGNGSRSRRGSAGGRDDLHHRRRHRTTTARRAGPAHPRHAGAHRAARGRTGRGCRPGDR